MSVTVAGRGDRPVGRPEGSGTFDYFTTAVNGEAGQIREDYRATDDIDELTGWIAGDADALGFMGIGNYLAADEEDRNVMATVAVDGVEPSLAGVQDGSYQALTRPLFLYVSVAALEEREDLEDFVSGYLDEVHDHLPLVYYYRFQEETYDKVRARFDERVTGSLSTASRRTTSTSRRCSNYPLRPGKYGPTGRRGRPPTAAPRRCCGRVPRCPGPSGGGTWCTPGW